MEYVVDIAEYVLLLTILRFRAHKLSMFGNISITYMIYVCSSKSVVCIQPTPATPSYEEWIDVYWAERSALR